MPVPEGTRTLVLNDDYTPINTVDWRKGFKKVLSENDCEECNGTGKRKGSPCRYCNGDGFIPPAYVIEYYDIWIRDSKNREHPVPAVICNTHHIKNTFRKVNFSKMNIFRRDGFRCQYCGKHSMTVDLTLDHVVPRSMWVGPGTPTCWHNIVTCCLDCNRKKEDRTPEQANMQLRKLINGNFVFYKKPKQPNTIELALRVFSGRKIIPEWEPYIKNFMTDNKLT